MTKETGISIFWDFDLLGFGSFGIWIFIDSTRFAVRGILGLVNVCSCAALYVTY